MVIVVVAGAAGHSINSTDCAKSPHLHVRRPPSVPLAPARFMALPTLALPFARNAIKNAFISRQVHFCGRKRWRKERESE